MTRLVSATMRLFLITVSLVYGPASTAQEPLTIRVADTLPPTHYFVRNATKYWMDEVTRRSNGAIKVEYYGSGQLGKIDAMLTLTTSGLADVGYIAPSTYADKMPLSGVAELPGMYSTSCAATMAYWRMANDGFLAQTEYKPLGVRVIFATVLAPYQVLTKGKFESLGDLKGKKLRSAGGPQNDLVKRLDSVPVRIAAQEQFESLSRGTIDGSIYPLPSVKPYDLDQHLKFSTYGQSFGTGIIAYMISEKKLASLPPNLRQLLLQIGEETTKRACEEVDKDDAAAAEELKKRGVTFVSLTAPDKKRLDDASAEVARDWAAALDKRGLKGTEALRQFSDGK